MEQYYLPSDIKTSKNARSIKHAYMRHTRVITRPKLRFGHERRPTDEQDETGRAINPYRDDGIIQQVYK
jgi:hypothetical protein